MRKKYCAMLFRLCNPPKKIKNIKIKRPYCCKNAFNLSKLSGSNLKNIHEPSSGGIGIKLKIASMMFICTIKENIKNNPGARLKTDAGKNRITRPKNNANTIFDRGPATATLKEPHL